MGGKMTDLNIVLNIKEKEIERLIAETEASLAGAPEGTLLIYRHRGYTEYYKRLPDKEKGERRIYIPRQDMELVRALAQKDYDIRVLKLLKSEQAAIGNLRAGFPVKMIHDIFNELPAERRKLVTPVILTDEEFVRKWLARPYEGAGFKEDDPGCYYTERGERVRSKSEVIIANALFHAKIPYLYEYPHVIAGRTIHPDFTILDIRTRREVILEHFGMLDNPDYLKNFQRKLDFYILNGLVPGRDFLFTQESSTRPLDTRVLMKMIEDCFCVR